MDDYLKILTNNKVKDFVVKEFGESFKSRNEKLFSKLREKQNIREIAESLYIFVETDDEVEKYVKMMQSSSPNN